jgi:hypothetical protein
MLFDEATEAASGCPLRRGLLAQTWQERARLFGTTQYEIAVAIVAVAVTMVIWFYASWLGFAPN